MRFVGKEEQINGIWYPVVVHADSIEEANEKLYVGQKKSYGIVQNIRGKWSKDI